MMDRINAARLDAKIAGWDWVASEFHRLREQSRAEADRLVGPDRGE